MISLPIARATFREKLRAPAVLALGALTLLVAPLRSNLDSFAAEPFGVFFKLLVLVVGAAVLSSELESGHAQLVLLRPLTRAAWVSGRLAGAALALAAWAAAAWLFATGLSLARGEPLVLWARALALPLALLASFAWLAVLGALSAILPRAWNAAVAVAALAGWKAFLAAAPLLLGHVGLALPLQALDPWVGPQDPFGLLAALRDHAPFRLQPLACDLAWLAGGWWAACLLFGRRELARRRV